MKKTFFYAGLLFVALSLLSIISCSSEENTVQQSEQTFKFEKTPEMVNFESSLKVWMQSKRSTVSDAKNKEEIAQQIEKDAKDLLLSFGQNESEIAGKANQNTDVFIHTVMREYSKKLTELYNQQINK